MHRYVIERDIPQVGSMDSGQLKAAAVKSCDALRQLGPQVQWVESYVADNKTFCVYLADGEEAIRKHAELSGFPANRITQIRAVMDPTTAG